MDKREIAWINAEVRFKFGFVELFEYVLFSLCREKSTKRAPRKESTHGTFLTNPIPSSARHYTRGEMATRCTVAV